MERDKITVTLPVQDGSHSIETAEVTKSPVTQANGIEISDCLRDKNNSLQIYVENTTGAASTPADSTITIKAGDNYPNAVLGDLTFAIKASKTMVILLEDIARFENRDKSIYVDFGSGFTGNIWAVAKRAGIEPAAQQNAVWY